MLKIDKMISVSLCWHLMKVTRSCLKFSKLFMKMHGNAEIENGFLVNSDLIVEYLSKEPVVDQG